jgi:hypothetical protein
MQATCGIAANSKAFHKGFTGIASSAAFLNLQRSSHQQGGEPMNPIFDTAMLKHHHVEYGNRIDTEGARRPVNAGRNFTFVMIALLAVSLVPSLNT